MATGFDREGNQVYIPEDPVEAAIRGGLEGAAESPLLRALMKIVGGVGHVAGAPARGVAALGQNVAGLGTPMDVSDAMLYGRDMNTGQEPVEYGTLLRKVGFGEDSPDSGLGALVEDAGNLAGDPLALLGSSSLSLLKGKAPKAPIGRNTPRPSELRKADMFRPTDRMVKDVTDHGAVIARNPDDLLMDFDLARPGPKTKLGVSGVPRPAYRGEGPRPTTRVKSDLDYVTPEESNRGGGVDSLSRREGRSHRGDNGLTISDALLQALANLAKPRQQ